MIKIDNTEDVNKYYKLVNDFIDKYILDWKIKPSKLAIYLKNSSKFEKFLDKNKLKEVWNINRILNDIIEDRTGIEQDGIIKFEKYNLLKENLINLDSADISYEKILADNYNIGLSHVTLFRKNLNLYKINDFDKNKLVVIYSQKDLIKNLENIRFYIQKAVLLSYHEIDDLEGYNFSLDLNLGEIINNDKLLSKLDELINANFFLSILKQNLYKEYKCDIIYTEYNGYYLLELISKK